MSHSWLQRKRKGDLLELAQRAHIPDADSLLKDDLVSALEDRLDKNESVYAKQPAFAEFYGRSGSPVKRERSSPSEALTVTKPRRRQTLVKSAETEEYTAEKSALVTRTPRTVSRVASRVSEVDFPASPAQLAEIADQSFQAAKTRATEWWDQTRIDEAREIIRENISSVGAIQTIILLVEATGLQWKTLVSTYAFDTPAVAGLSLRSHDIHLPNLWLLLTNDWWAPTTLWSLTSWVLPLLVSYFFNLTLRSNTHHKSSRSQSRVDPLTFNITKAILVYSAFYVQTVAEASLAGQPDAYLAPTPGWGPFSQSSVDVVRNNAPGGYFGLQIGAAVGVLVAIYDAALKR